MLPVLSLLTALALLPSPDGVVRDAVDVAEHNRFYDEQGRPVFEQVIFWTWDGDRFQVRAWRLVKGTIDPRPTINANGSGYVSEWKDGDCLRSVHASAVRDSWTTYDPELTERDYLPKERRANLSPVLRAKGGVR